MFLFVGSEHGGFLNGASFWQLKKFSSLGGSGLGYFKDRVEMGLSFQCDLIEDFAVYDILSPCFLWYFDHQKKLMRF